MEKLVYVKELEATHNKVYCVHKNFESDIWKMLCGFKYRALVYKLEDNKSVYLVKNEYSVSDREFWYSLLSMLKENGFMFTSMVEGNYEYYQKEHYKLEEQKRLEREQKETKLKEQEEYILWCPKYDCATNIGFCINKCKYNTSYGMNCRPKRVKIKKEGI